MIPNSIKNIFSAVSKIPPCRPLTSRICLGTLRWHLKTGYGCELRVRGIWTSRLRGGPLGTLQIMVEAKPILDFPLQPWKSEATAESKYNNGYGCRHSRSQNRESKKSANETFVLLRLLGNYTMIVTRGVDDNEQGFEPPKRRRCLISFLLCVLPFVVSQFDFLVSEHHRFALSSL
jgi:hypothetical protein